MARSARIVGLAENPWEGAWMNRQQILSRLARTHAVLYSNGTFSSWDVGDPDWRRAGWLGGFARQDGVLLDRPPAALLRVKNRALIDRWILALAAARWRRRIAREGSGPLVAYVFHPRMWPFAQALDADILLYHAYDLFKFQVGWSPAVAQYEQALTRAADLVVGSSEVICEELRAQGAPAPVLLPNGADFDAFAVEPQGEGPADLAGIPRPRIGYIGKLSRKVDLPLVAVLARANPRWHFVFVGSDDKLDAESAAGVAATKATGNVHFLGFKPHTDLPAYAIRMDVNVICHRLDGALWTHGTFPLKLFEYLAAGPPVISTDIPSVRPYAAVVAIARTPEEWQEALAAALEHDAPVATKESRRAVARQNTWDHRVAHLDSLLQELIRDAD